MPYLFIASILVAFLTGGFAGYRINEFKIDMLERSIEFASIQARNDLIEAQRQTEEAQKNAIKSNRELDKAHESAIKTINSLHADLADAIDARLRAERAKDHSDALSAGSNPRDSKKASSIETEFSTELSAVIAEKARLADELAIYADTAFKFINNNCGIVYDNRTGNN